MTDLAVEILGEAIPRAGSAAGPAHCFRRAPPRALEQVRAYALGAAPRRPRPGHGSSSRTETSTKALAQVKQWPLVIKPGRSLFRSNGQWHKTSVHYAQRCRTAEERSTARWATSRSPRSCKRGSSARDRASSPCSIAASRWPGSRTGGSASDPPSGGVSVLCESVPLRKPLVDYALRILQSAAWHGVAMVEFKLDARSGIPHLMEVNGRFWGSLQLAIDAGVDFPWLLYQLAATGSAQPPAAPYATGRTFTVVARRPRPLAAAAAQARPGAEPPARRPLEVGDFGIVPAGVGCKNEGRGPSPVRSATRRP